MADTHRAVSKLQEKFAASILEVKEDRGDWIVTVSKESIIAVLSFLKAECRYTMLTDVTAVDYLGKKDERFMMVYQMTSVVHKDEFVSRRRLANLIPVLRVQPRFLVLPTGWSGRFLTFLGSPLIIILTCAGF